MKLSTLKSGRMAALFFAHISAFALGCVLSVGNGGTGKDAESCESNSTLSNGQCFCNVGFDWCDANDITDLSCCSTGTSESESNSNSNSNSESNGTTGSETEAIPTTSEGTSETDTDTESDGTTGEPPMDCIVDEVPPASCNPDDGESFLCLEASNADCGPEGSQFYLCENGVWVLAQDVPQDSCQADGWDFSFGCLNDADGIAFECESGPGTACDSNTQDSCASEVDLNYCLWGKTVNIDCEVECQFEGDGEGVTYDYGFCGDQRGEIVCICCDEGDRGCPITEPDTDSESESETGETSETDSDT